MKGDRKLTVCLAGGIDLIQFLKMIQKILFDNIQIITSKLNSISSVIIEGIYRLQFSKNVTNIKLNFLPQNSRDQVVSQ